MSKRGFRHRHPPLSIKDALRNRQSIAKFLQIGAAERAIYLDKHCMLNQRSLSKHKRAVACLKVRFSAKNFSRRWD